ncbi:hypothetical protein HMPREF3155_08410 [Corynebacterium sp. HMSC06D04]|uniref:hypothetical protein n=1 Tax=unclassified Corynebacterium TaxID=2624378 RepID=UPI0008A42329|nr:MULTISPECIES: hypothetical protein [unclassified Corynebacterium]OFT34792.1 hypothetical protein HMPREF3169_06065 [Corynebacterium sp. HMSC08C04]OFT50921.1 hypothetical protein HMPREF3155_08410 [Corynebacterium sp. HMSC06D04]
MIIKIDFDAVNQTGRWALSVKDDATEQGMRSLIFDAPPRKLSASRIVLAGIVFWGGKGRFSTSNPLPDNFVRTLEAHGISIVAPLDSSQGSISPKATTLQVQADLRINAQLPGRDRTYLYLPASERFQGSLRGVKEIVVGSNAHWLESIYGPRALLSAAILFSEDLMVESIDMSEYPAEAIPRGIEDLVAVEGIQVITGS